MSQLLEPISGRKRYIVTFKKKNERRDKTTDKNLILQQSVEPRLNFFDVANQSAGFAAPADPEGLVALDVNDYKIPTVFASLTEREVAQLSKDPNVAKVEPDGIVRALELQFTQLPLGSGFTETSLDTRTVQVPSAQADAVPWGISTIGAPSCWEATQGRGIYVGVIDSGIAPHADLAGNLLGGVSFVPGETWVDANGHG
ncbi:MAG: protease inhibitor I9 family protein, partial [Nitrososphaerales archaeon]